MNHNPKNPVWEVAKFLFLMAGGVCLILLIRQTGWKQLVAELSRIGWWFIPYMVLHAADEALKTSAWKASFPGYRKLNWRKLYCISWIGSAVTQIYQTGELGSGMTRVAMLRNEVSTHLGIASVLITILADAVALILFILCGMIFVIRTPDIPDALKISLIIAFVTLSLSVFIFWAIQRRGFMGVIRQVTEKLPIPSLIKSHLLENSIELNESIQAYHGSQVGNFCEAVGFYIARRFLGILQVQLILYCLGVPGGFERSLLISLFSSLIDSVFFFVPGRLGTHEGGRLLIAKALGMTTAQGLAIGIISRLTQIIWAILGFAILLFWKKRPAHLAVPKEDAGT